MVFFVQYARGGGHPLHIALSYYTAAATAIVMGHSAFVSDGNGFKTAVGMHSNASGGIGWSKIMLRIIIHHNEWIGAVHVYPITARNKCMYPKTIANEMRLWGCHDEFYLF